MRTDFWNNHFPIVRSVPLYLALSCIVSCTSSPPLKPAVPAHTPKVTRPGIAADFPGPESFYPPEARRLFREGLVVVRYCVDAQGKLLEMPTVAKSSGSPDLDSAGVLLASAGNGHYVAGRRDGIAVSGCSELGVRFQIAEDPRWPSLATREKSIQARLVQGISSARVEAEASVPKPPELRSCQDLAALRHYARVYDDARAKDVALTKDYVSAMDELANSPTAPPTEREAFQTYWAGIRETQIRYAHEMDVDAQEFIKLVNQIADYCEQANPPLFAASGGATPKPTRVQQRQLLQLVERVAVVDARMRATTATLAKQAGATANESPTGAATRPGIAADFPSPESFYPLESRDLFREGRVVVRYCVDEQGKLLDAPTVARSSGSPDLDSAGVLLATAGNGHYVAGRRDGVPISGCNELAIRFQMPRDLRWPSLAERENSLNARLAQGSSVLAAEMEKASAQLSGPDLRSWEDLAALRRYTRVCDEARARETALIREYVRGMDELAHSTKAPQAEREAFQKYWAGLRDSTISGAREIDLAEQETVKTMTQLADYYESASPPLLTASGDSAPTATPVQQGKLRELVERAAAAAARLEAVLNSTDKPTEESKSETPEEP